MTRVQNHRALSVGLLVLLLGSPIAGCGDDDSNGKPDTGTNTAPATPTGVDGGVGVPSGMDAGATPVATPSDAGTAVSPPTVTPPVVTPPVVTPPVVPAPPEGARYITSSLVFGADTTTTYINVLKSLDTQTINYGEAREFPGWADVWIHEGKIFVADGEAPTLTKYGLDEKGSLVEEGRMSFLNTGATTAAFWANLFVSPTKAYLFVMQNREAVIWNPVTLEITGTIKLPALPDREGGLELQVPSADRSSIVRGNRAYVPTLWANFDDDKFSDDSVILVIDTDTDQVLNTLTVPCPDLNVGTRDESGDLYFSNWVFSVSPTLLRGAPKNCAVRVKAGSDQLDPTWSLTFADATQGREAAALRFLGAGKALLSVFLHEQVTLSPTVDPSELISGENWQFWTLDLTTKQATPVSGIPQHSGGYYSTRIDSRNHVFVPSADYGSTQALELSPDGTVTPRWKANGWTTRLFRVR